MGPILISILSAGLLSRIVSIGLLFLFIFTSGLWLNKIGKPVNGILLTIHKFISLGTLVLIAVTIYQIKGDVKISALELSASVVTGLLFLCNIISGGLLSIDKPMPAVISTIHMITPLVAVIFTAVTLYLVVISGIV